MRVEEFKTRRQHLWISGAGRKRWLENGVDGALFLPLYVSCIDVDLYHIEGGEPSGALRP